MREKATDVLGHDRVSFPEIKLASGIKHKTIYTDVAAADMADLLYATCLEWDERRKSQRWHFLLQLFIPFVFWLFRGFEAALLLFVYMLKELGLKRKHDSRGRAIRILSVLFTIITGLTSLLSYLKIKL